MTLPQKPPNGVLLDLRRRAQLTLGGARAHNGEVLEEEMEDFDIQKTIFKTMDPFLHEAVRSIYGKVLFWSDRAVQRIVKDTGEELARPGSRWAEVAAKKPELLQFMHEECEFDLEHADGSFIEHLEFCFEYCAVYFPTGRPIVLFLHSILGVGTNLFPCLLEQRDRLASFVTTEELVHIECFPSVLRLLQTDLLPTLEELPTDRLVAIDSLECHRLLGLNMRELMRSDNHVLRLSGSQVWEHLHYQLIHGLDFLPALDWEERCTSSMFPLVVGLHRLLRRAGGSCAGGGWRGTVCAIGPSMPTHREMVVRDHSRPRHRLTIVSLYCDGACAGKLQAKVDFESDLWAAKMAAMDPDELQCVIDLHRALIERGRVGPVLKGCPRSVHRVGAACRWRARVRLHICLRVCLIVWYSSTAYAYVTWVSALLLARVHVCACAFTRHWSNSNGLEASRNVTRMFSDRVGHNLGFVLKFKSGPDVVVRDAQARL